MLIVLKEIGKSNKNKDWSDKKWHDCWNGIQDMISNRANWKVDSYCQPQVTKKKLEELSWVLIDNNN